MSRFTRTLAPGIVALAALAGSAMAQTAATPPPADAPQRQDHGGRHHGPSPETMQRMQDGKFAMIKAALKLNDAQLKLWQPVEDLVRSRQAARVENMKAHMAERSGANANTPAPSFADRLDRTSKRMAERAEQAKTFAATFRPFYDSLSEDQKKVVGPLFAELTGGHHMRGHRWASREGHRQQ